MKKKYRVVFKKARNREWFWRVTHRNGRIIARSSETYKRKFDCRRSLGRLINAFVDGAVDVIA